MILPSSLKLATCQRVHNPRAFASDCKEDIDLFSRLFNPDSEFWQFVSKVADIILLNILFFVFSIPIVTIGASLSALYDVTWKVQDDRGGGTARLFVTSFKENFRASTLLWLIFGSAGLLIALLWIVTKSPELSVIKSLFTCVYLLIFPFPWTLQARFVNNFGSTLKNSFLIPLGRLPWAIAIFAVQIILLILFWSVLTYIPAAFPPLALGGYALIVYAITPLIQKTLAPWLSEG